MVTRRDLTPRPPGSQAAKILPDGRLATLYSEIFGSRILIGPADDMTGGDEYIQFRDADIASNHLLLVFQNWDGYGYPMWWYRRKFKDNPFIYNEMYAQDD